VYNVLIFISILNKDKGAEIAHSFEELGCVLDDEGILVCFCLGETSMFKAFWDNTLCQFAKNCNSS
jgi:hypothetical protein